MDSVFLPESKLYDQSDTALSKIKKFVLIEVKGIWTADRLAEVALIPEKTPKGKLRADQHDKIAKKLFEYQARHAQSSFRPNEPERENIGREKSDDDKMEIKIHPDWQEKLKDAKQIRIEDKTGQVKVIRNDEIKPTFVLKTMSSEEMDEVTKLCAQFTQRPNLHQTSKIFDRTVCLSD